MCWRLLFESPFSFDACFGTYWARLVLVYRCFKNVIADILVYVTQIDIHDHPYKIRWSISFLRSHSDQKNNVARRLAQRPKVVSNRETAWKEG